jgi:WD40 repeat protein
VISGRCLSTFRGHKGALTAVALSHFSSILASASSDRTIKLWNVSSGECLSTLRGHSHEVTSVIFSHDSTQVASLSKNGIVKVWNTLDGENVQTLECHSGPPSFIEEPHDGPDSSIAFSHDATQLASVSSDRTIEIWERNSSKCLHTVDVDRQLSKISFHKSGLYISTDVGLIAIPAPSGPDRGVVAPDLQPTNHHHGGLSMDGKWITYNSANVLWLPSEYRPSCSAVSGNLIGIAFGGRVLICTLSRGCP